MFRAWHDQLARIIAQGIVDVGLGRRAGCIICRALPEQLWPFLRLAVLFDA